ncbi:MAG: ABC transporter ATP-binding protein, partial [Paracoccus sp. (in: a-proteobacteria)]
VTALIGPNAAGKSTLLRGLAGLSPARGSLTLDGQDLSRLSVLRRADLVGYMPQGVIDPVGMSVLDCVMIAMPHGSASRDEAALAHLARHGADDLANSPVARLSGGQRQVLGLVLATARDPRVLLLDEPTSALDMNRRHTVMSRVRDLAAEGRAALVVLHDLALAAQWADHVAVLSHGRLHAFGPPFDVITPPMLRDVYRVAARVEPCSAGRLQIMIDGAIDLS